MPTAAPRAPISASCARWPTTAANNTGATERQRGRAEVGGSDYDADSPGGQTPVTEAPGEKGYVEDGLAVAPASAPEEVKAIVAAGNKIARQALQVRGRARPLARLGL